MGQVMQSEGVWVANASVEGTNGTTHGPSVGIDGLGGVVDGVGVEVNDASGTDKMGGQFLHVPGCRGLCGDSEGCTHMECRCSVCLGIPPVYA